MQACEAQIGIAQVCTIKPCLAEVGALQLCATQIRITQVGMHKIRIRQLAFRAFFVLQKHHPIVCRQGRKGYTRLRQHQSCQEQALMQGNHVDPVTGRFVSALAVCVEGDWAG